MLMVSIIITIVPFSVSAATNGICGESLTWSLDDGTLTISGEGEMNDYNYNYINEEHIIDTPWFDKRNQIKSVVIEEGVTQIGDFAFRGCDNLTYVTFPSGLIEIGYEAFWGCNLSDVTFPDGLIELGDGAFMCTNLSKVILPDSLKKIDNRCFHVCESLSEIYIGKSVEYIGDHSFSVTNISSITMPQSVKYIGECVFAHNELNNIYYEGTKSQWDNIEKSNVWDYAIKNGEKLVINYKENGKVTDYASYNPNSINISIDGNYIKFDVQPQIINGRTLVPMRKIFEELGAVVNWDASTQTAIGTKDNIVVKFTINDYTMYKNESAKTLDVPAQLINGRTLIPLRAVSEAFDCQVGWDGNDSIVSIIDDSENYTMLYALNDRSKSFPSNTVDAQLTVGWYTEPVQTLYAVGKSAVFKKSEVSAQLSVGWYEYPVIQLYANDGRTMVIKESELSSYENVGWSKTNPKYKPLGRKITASDIDVELIGTNFVINNKSEYTLEIDRLYVDGKYHDIIGTGKATVKPYEVKAVYCECDHGYSAHDTSSDAYIWVTQTVPRADGAEYRYVFKVSFTINGIYKFECIVD